MYASPFTKNIYEAWMTRQTSQNAQLHLGVNFPQNLLHIIGRSDEMPRTSYLFRIPECETYGVVQRA